MISTPTMQTELCRSWEELGSCRYGSKCQFAHGREELRPVQRHPKYKTEVRMCKRNKQIQLQALVLQLIHICLLWCMLYSRQTRKNYISVLQVCRTFAQTGTCPYGTRCRFIHHDASLASLKSSRDSSSASLNMLDNIMTPQVN